MMRTWFVLKQAFIYIYNITQKKKKNQKIIQIKSNEAGLKKLLICCHPTLGLRVGSVGWDFFHFGEGQFCFQGFTAF